MKTTHGDVDRQKEKQKAKRRLQAKASDKFGDGDSRSRSRSAREKKNGKNTVTANVSGILESKEIIEYKIEDTKKCPKIYESNDGESGKGNKRSFFGDIDLSISKRGFCEARVDKEGIVSKVHHLLFKSSKERNEDDSSDEEEENANSPLIPFNLKTLLEQTASENIHVWLKSKSKSGKDGHNDKKNEIVSFETNNVDTALSCYQVGGSLYFRGSEELEQAMLNEILRDLNVGNASHYNAQNQKDSHQLRGEIETFVSRAPHVTNFHWDFQHNFTSFSFFFFLVFDLYMFPIMAPNFVYNIYIYIYTHTFLW
ncbi:hypothetical protein RFI_38629 [Reticulomyxa filosa]|uniref:Uncharacterized protein n=1 Tax=Reticulomyxa filosa TaxID=46433 RepID=X6LDS4_RETFI|nr:hypothetical protein RFI_38629 [Reticulomyxa filosa]|eukprot:ETN98859.1 hypothetical protein RFI_38629 [Reticulomyxa filosa]